MKNYNYTCVSYGKNDQDIQMFIWPEDEIFLPDNREGWDEEGIEFVQETLGLDETMESVFDTGTELDWVDVLEILEKHQNFELSNQADADYTISVEDGKLKFTR